MKIYRRKEFLALPAGTIYCKGKEMYFEGLNVKGDSILAERFNDFYSIDPAWIDAQDSNEAFDRLEKMLRDGASFPMQDAICRDGLFDSDAIFLVFERDDLLKLRGWIDAALGLTS